MVTVCLHKLGVELNQLPGVNQPTVGKAKGGGVLCALAGQKRGCILCSYNELYFLNLQGGA